MSVRNVIAVVAVAMVAACGPKVATLTVPEKLVSLTAAGQEKKIAFEAKDEKETLIENAKVTFTSSAPEIATVDAEGKIVAVKTGDAVVTVAASDTIKEEVNVKVMVPATMTLLPPELKLMVGERQMVRARVLDEKQRDVPGQKPEWSSAATDVAGVTNGVVNGVKVGNTQITATLGTIKAQVAVRVLPAVASVEVKGVSLDMKKTKEAKLAPVAKDAEGKALENMNFLFKSSDDKVATVDPAGVVKAVGKGKTEITVLSAGKEAKAEVVVK